MASQGGRMGRKDDCWREGDGRPAIGVASQTGRADVAMATSAQ